jgi:hypothetical protein
MIHFSKQIFFVTVHTERISVYTSKKLFLRGPHDVGSDSLYSETVKKTGLSKFGSGERVSSIFMFLVPWQSWPSETSFSWNKILPWKEFLVKDGEINSVTRVFRTGWLRKFEGIRINLSHLGLVSGLCQGSRVFQHWNTGTRSYTRERYW